MADVTTAPAPAAAATAPGSSSGEHKYVFNVSMSCGGCSGAVERVLKKLEGTLPLFLLYLCLLSLGFYANCRGK
jgi:hypothetical protein